MNIRLHATSAEVDQWISQNPKKGDILRRRYQEHQAPCLRLGAPPAAWAAFAVDAINMGEMFFGPEPVLRGNEQKARRRFNVHRPPRSK